MTVRASRAIRIHRGVLLGRGRGWAQPVLLLTNLWSYWRWLARGADEALAEVEQSRLAQLTDGTGVQGAVQRERLRTLARRHSIPPSDALRFGLVRDDWSHRWPDFVYDCETGWNAAASGRRGWAQLRLLGDKVETAQRLTAAGIAYPEEVRREPVNLTEPEVAALVTGWLRRWPEIHCKRRFGSRGEGAFRIASGNPSGGDAGTPDLPQTRWTVRKYPSETSINDPLVWLIDRLTRSEHLIQPRLTSHPMFEGVAGHWDVVTVRIVTRDIGGGPEIFSMVLEVPLPLTDGHQSYVIMRLDDQGLVTGTVRPGWLRQPQADEVESTPAGIVEARLVGLQLTEFAGVAANAVHAHELFPGLFAVAWDVAVTDTGYLFLEGNGGFGTRVPQWVGGGLLAGLD